MSKNNKNILFYLGIFLLPSLTALAQTQAPAVTARTPSVCEITGIVMNIEKVMRSPWKDGTPSPLSKVETQISIGIHGRAPQDKKAKPDDPCHTIKKNEVRTYKLCSPTKVRKGDRIHAVEGSETGSVLIPSCLFDIIVLPKPQSSN